ncbi:hypothetical protein [Catellatospora citrea]|uniref:Uncharacterized protein n=1 Tax=Catellatospora citrea TaxID=53366 RepID=A0A8J3KVE8_9ACTN|nr:hypothetical protein [Catellatospora citrea]RKE07811.1 hypothetical protein C8E86_2647 [Catellatospora citrea]GIG01965.1 hypothetical protein Cci01nite_70580 [Catellatospora citrea]
MAREPLAGFPDRLTRTVALAQQVMAAIRSGIPSVDRVGALPFEVLVSGGARSIAVGVEHIGGPLLGLPAPRRAARCAI